MAEQTQARARRKKGVSIDVGIPMMGLDAFIRHAGLPPLCKGRFIAYLERNNLVATHRTFEQWTDIQKNIN